METEIVFDNTTARLTTIDSKLVNAAFKALSYEIPGSEFAGRGKKGWRGPKAPTKASFFSIASWQFPTGLIGMVRDAFKEIGYSVKLKDVRERPEFVWKDGTPIDTFVESCLDGITLRDYQVQAVIKIFSYMGGVPGRGIIKVPTGGGKTLVATAAMKIAADQGIKSLFITHALELLYQTAKVIETRSGIPAGVIGDGEITFGKITVATVETIDAIFRAYKDLQAYQKSKKTPEELARLVTKAEKHLALKSISDTIRKETQKEKDELERWLRISQRDPERIVLRRNELIRFLQSVGMLFLDEAHRGSGSQFQAAVKACPNAYFRIGLTATPFMKSDLEDMKLAAVTGEVIHEIHIQDLVDRGLLAQPVVKFIKVAKPVISKSTKYPAAYKKGIVLNTERNKQVCYETIKLARAGRKVLVLVKTIEHGNALYRVLSGFVKCAWIHGAKDTKTRQEAFEAIEHGDLQVLIASTIMDEGVDLPSISAVVLAGGGDSAIKLMQRIGRGMRLTNGGPAEALIVDFIDLTSPYLAKHSLSRYQAVRNEKGYKVVERFF